MSLVDRLPPSAFAFVMATGIVSSAAHEVGADTLSHVLLAVAVAGFAVLTVLLGVRLAGRPSAALADATHPQRAFGHFTIIAAIGVVVAQLSEAGATGPVAALTWIALAVWALLTYGLPAALMLSPHPSPVAAEIDGSWFLWVVGTQSVAICLTVADLGLDDLAPVLAVGLWGVGIVLYLMLATLVMLRLLSTTSSAESLNPSYWIFMGATAISVLAASHVLALPAEAGVVAVTTPFVSGFAVVLWAFGTWWIPLLVVFGVWRHGVARARLTYETGLWSMVFPLGMYAVATTSLAQAVGIDRLEPIGTGAAWVALVAWAGVAALGSATAIRTARESIRAR